MVEQGSDNDGAAIPVSDVIPNEVVITYDKDHPKMDLGTMYPSMKEFRLAVRQFAINEEFDIGTEKSDKKRFRGFCKSSEDCPWRIVGSLQDDKCTVKVTVLVDQHDCVSSSRVKTITPSQDWVANKAVSILRSSPNMGAKELQKKLQEQYKVTILYDTVWRGKEKALAEVYGKWEESFEMLYKWKAEVLKRSPGSVVEIEVLEIDGNVYFHRFFCALKPCIDGFLEGCRPHLSIDSTALNGRWNGHLASATAVDGHNWMYPLAFGFIASETEDNWTWFMNQLKMAIGDPPLLAVCTDACKGLENAVKNVFPNAEQRECFYHLTKNFSKRFHGFGRMYPAARAYREDVFTEHMAAIIKQSDEVWKWLSQYHTLKWMRCVFNPDIKCDYITNNVAEVFNNWIRDIKDLPVAELADKIREMIMLLWRKRRRIGERLPPGRILPAIMVQLRANTRGLGHLKVVESANWSAEVWDNSKNCERHVMKLNQQTCTCLEWQHTGKPCQHVLAFVTSQERVNLEQFVHEYYSVDRFKAAYGREIEPMTDKSQWPRVELPFVVGAPLAKRNKGRQRKLRIKGCLEGGHKKKGANDAPKDDSTAPTNSKGKKMIRGPVTCKKCGEKGHRQASYKCPLNGTKKRKRKPRKNSTKARPAEPSTPQRPTREQILQDSPSMVTRSRLAILLGEGSSSRTTRTTPERMPTAAPPKKMTPRRMPTAAPPKKITPKRKLPVG
ncbi:uncharacterized protein LOC119337427 isoform X4 [Triticum dicoccoides]|nr:uncharacterized protein LOC119337427 isoform X4 [Triticum dicoccoides]XP_037465459.1 uncharacterized protein LOC119337427 isoform X4 [Triticum dicoccoides]XP_037465460.1 uncharacterized protein LOC119337427 isoform X4 [Triticum dicoccoides]XP_037465461.1 uncharacterized protein LOC119337427 isoform X4 [Triticum dicoccoides]